jgi:hypothetical protein
LGAVNDDSGQGVSAVKECKAREQADVKEKKWKEQIGAERDLKHWLCNWDERNLSQQGNEANKKLTMWRGALGFLYEVERRVESGRKHSFAVAQRFKGPAPH